MKIIKTFYSLIIVFSCLTISSCTKDFAEINTDPNKIEQISPGTLLNPIIYGVTGFNATRFDAFTSDIMQGALPFPSVTGGVHRYDVTESAGNSTWNTYYRWLANIKEMQVSAEAAQDPNYQGIALTLNAWVYSLLSDSFGDVPMSEAVRGDEQIFRPAFDAQKDIYAKILADLEKANGLFTTSKTMIYGTEILYGNNVSNWQRFCNSLRLRLLLRVSKRTEMNAYTKMAEILNNPVKNPIFTQNSEAAVLKITGTVPNVSPWGRAIDFSTFRAAGEFFVSNLNNFNDPRRAKFLTQARSSDGKTNLGFRGIPSGFTGPDSQFAFQPSGLNNLTVTAPMIAVLMSYAEVEFIKAEVAQQGKIALDAKVAYEKGVRAAIEMWGLTVPSDYFSTTQTAYNNTLSQIMLQKYYALYFTDYQQWFEYRRTGLPVLPKGAGMLNNQVMPVRFKYPTTVATNNSENYKKAVASMGGTDDINTKVWWEK